MALYIKKPVVVEAMRWDGSLNGKLMIEKYWPSLLSVYVRTHAPTNIISYWSVDTDGRSSRVNVGDYIVKHSNGDFEVVDANSFNEMYEYVE